MAGRAEVLEQQAFVEDLGLGGITHIVDPDGSIWGSYSINSQPAFVFIDDDGTSSVHIGALGDEELTNQIERLIAN